MGKSAPSKEVMRAAITRLIAAQGNGALSVSVKAVANKLRNIFPGCSISDHDLEEMIVEHALLAGFAVMLDLHVEKRTADNDAPKIFPRVS